MACVGTAQVCATATLFSGGTTKMVPLQCWRRTIVSPPTCRRGRWVVFLTACTVALGACATSAPTGTTSVATKLAFTEQPGATAAGADIAPALQVTIQDASGNTVTSATTRVTVALGTNPSGASLFGTLTVAAVNGVATFSTLSVNS